MSRYRDVLRVYDIIWNICVYKYRTTSRNQSKKFSELTADGASESEIERVTEREINLTHVSVLRVFGA